MIKWLILKACFGTRPWNYHYDDIKVNTVYLY